jgi:hypothetical protein
VQVFVSQQRYDGVRNSRLYDLCLLEEAGIGILMDTVSGPARKSGVDLERIAILSDSRNVPVVLGNILPIDCLPNPNYDF